MRGCLTMGMLLAIAALMYVVNGVIVGMVYAQISPNGPTWLQQPKVAQILMFTTPILLLAAQWWVFDVFTGWVGRLSRRRS